MNIIKPEHTEHIKKTYTTLERTIKCKLTELLLLHRMWTGKEFCRGLSFTRDFKVRELDQSENNKFLCNVSTIKNPTLYTNETKIRDELFDHIDRHVRDATIAEQYKEGINEFIWHQIFPENIRFLKAHPIYQQFLSQHHEKYKNLNQISHFNVLAQVGKILYLKFGAAAFKMHIDEETQLETLKLSDTSLTYLSSLFFNANIVRKQRGKNLDQVFHDGDFPFIWENTKASEEEYFEVLKYLVDREKHNPHGKDWAAGNREWAKKTSQYSDILWALTNDALKFHTSTFMGKEEPNFEWDMTTKKLFEIWGGTLRNVVDTHNTFHQQNFKLTWRLKSLASAIEKIIEWKKLNDTIGLRISLQNINTEHFESLLKISTLWLQQFITSLQTHPEKYVAPGQKIKMTSLTLDNKNVLSKEHLQTFIDSIQSMLTILPDAPEIKARSKAKQPYIEEKEWVEAMKRNYEQDVQDNDKWATLVSFFRQFTWGKDRGSNWGYKDFKMNIDFEVEDPIAKNAPISTYHMEVQFDDINNGLGIANYNIRNCERSINTQSRLSFDVPLAQARKIVETNLKKMHEHTKKMDKKFQTITMEDGSIINLASFQRRTLENSSDFDRAIIKIINYFLQKGTFFLYHNSWNQGEEKNIYLEQGLLTTKNLSEGIIENIHICTSLEVATQQHSYLQEKRNDKVGIYIPEHKKIGWIWLWELIDRINLWKKKNPDLTYPV